MPYDALQRTLQALRWSFEREEETARLYHNRAQLVLTVVSAILGIGFFRLGSLGRNDPMLGPLASVVVACFVGLSLLLSVFAVFSTVAGMRLPWRREPEERDRHVARLLLMEEDLFDGLAEGDDERVMAELIGQLDESVREFSDKNEKRRLEIRDGLSWLLAALVAGFSAVGIYLAAYTVGRLEEPPPAEELECSQQHEQAMRGTLDALGGGQ